MVNYNFFERQLHKIYPDRLIVNRSGNDCTVAAYLDVLVRVGQNGFLSLSISLEGEVNSCRKFSARFTWVHLDGFEGCAVAAETRIYPGSSWWLHLCSLLLRVPSWSSVSFSANVYHKVDDFSFPVVLYTFPGNNVPVKMGYNGFSSQICKNLFSKGWFCGTCWEGFIPSC